jgi:hypothetical protein
MNLYDLPTNGEPRAFCGGNLQGEHESCLAVTPLADGAGYALTDTKTEGAGRELRMTPAELDRFAHGWIQSRDRSR